MKCANHPEIDAVATCVDCGKGLCSDCTSAYEFPICENCNAARVGDEKKELLKNIALTALFFCVGVYFAVSSGGSGKNIVGIIMFGYIFAGIPWGWSFLNKITPNIFLFMPIIGWVIYFFIKGILSLFIGFIALPIKIFQIIRDRRRLAGIASTFGSAE